MITLDDILHDLEGTRKVEQRLADFFGSEVESARRGRPDGTVRTRGFGRDRSRARKSLLERCAAANQMRWKTLLYFEDKLRHDDDYGYLIVPACQILESELDRLLTAPARGIAGSLIAALEHSRKDRALADIIEKWAGDQVPTTIGTGSLVLLALRRGLEQRLEPVLAFLGTHFALGFTALLASKELGRCLDAIRTRYRNPACHGTSGFDAEAYGEFTRLVVANSRFAAWAAEGPDPPEPGAELGILHHHLHHARLSETRPAIATKSSVASRETASVVAPDHDQDPPRRPAGVCLVVSVEAAPGIFRKLASVPASTDVAAVTPEEIPRSSPGPIRLRTGDCVRIELVAEREGYVAVFAIGPTGNFSLLYPDDPSSTTLQTPVQAQRVLHVADVELTPPLGRERLFAVWNREPLALRSEQLQRLAGCGEIAGVRPPRASRDLKRVTPSFDRIDLRECSVVSLELDHDV